MGCCMGSVYVVGRLFSTGAMYDSGAAARVAAHAWRLSVVRGVVDDDGCHGRRASWCDDIHVKAVRMGAQLRCCLVATCV